MRSNTDALFRTLADSTRRQILDLLAERGPLSVGQLAAEFPDLVQSGISKHLMSLRAAGLVSAARQGRKQVYRLEPDALIAELTPWIAKYEQYWSAGPWRKTQTRFSENRPKTEAEMKFIGNDQYRICFVWADEGPERVEITDYH